MNRGACTATQHGDLLAYNRRGCRCPSAREEYRIYRKRLREGRAVPAFIDGTGTARRLQSLVASGHRQADLAKRLGFSGQFLAHLIHLQKPRVTRVTESRIKELFRELDGTDGGSRYARGVARRNNWVDAAAWDDIDDPAERPKLGRKAFKGIDERDVEVKVRRAIEGSPQELTPREKRLAVEILTRRRKSQKEIAEVLSISERRVCGHRARARELVAS